MIRRWTRGLSWPLTGKRAVSPSVPDGHVVFAIGDVHAHYEEFDTLLALIGEECATYKGERVLVCLGDYIDRGPDSRAVIERLMQGPLPGDTHHILMGNHERVLLDIVDEGAPSGPSWLGYGGFELLESYGLKRAELLKHKRSLRQSIIDTLPAAHLDFLRSLPKSVTIGDYFFAHAGVRPGTPLDEQSERDLLWIREGFVDSKRDHGKVIVHGHTIEDGPVDRPNRIGLDTGCYAGGALSAVCLEGETRRFITVPSTGMSWKRTRGSNR